MDANKYGICIYTVIEDQELQC